MADADILAAAGKVIRKGIAAGVGAAIALGVAGTDIAARPSRDAWVAIRTEQGRATAADWRETAPLLGYQRAIAIACEQYDVVFVEKSRRTGATWGAASDAVLRSASPRSDGGMDTLYMGTSHDMAKEFIDAAANWARMLEHVCSEIGETLFDDGSDDGIKALKIDFASGFSIVALSSKPRSLRGRQGFAILDEAAFVDNLGELLKAAMAFLMWGGKVLVISTHNGADNPFNQTITDIRAGRVRYGLVRFDLDEALRDGLFERMCLVNAHKHGEWSPEKEADWREKLIADYRDAADEELYCIPSQGSGAWQRSQAGTCDVGSRPPAPHHSSPFLRRTRTKRSFVASSAASQAAVSFLKPTSVGSAATGVDGTSTSPRRCLASVTLLTSPATSRRAMAIWCCGSSGTSATSWRVLPSIGVPRTISRTSCGSRPIEMASCTLRSEKPVRSAASSVKR